MPTPNQQMARAMSRRFLIVKPSAATGSDKFELSEDEQRALLAIWQGMDKDLLGGLFARQMEEYLMALRTVDVAGVQECRAKLSALEHFWGRIERTVAALGEG